MSAIIKAEKTLKAIEDQMYSDQGAKFRIMQGKVMPHMGDAYRGHDDPFRSHLGASVIGRGCAREIWYGFRWFTKKFLKAQLLRLFNRGHLEEARFIAMLLAIDCQVYQQDADGNQFRISDCGGHFGGSGDGVAVGVPDVPAGQPCLLEAKTHGAKSFKKLKDEGVRLAKPEHFVQMQTYMRKMQIYYALYMAVCKDNDEIWFEIVVVDNMVADQYIDRGRQIIFMRSPPKRISENAGWYECAYCDHKPVCHGGSAPDKNCRTCYWSHPEEDGSWRCGNNSGDAVIDKATQLTGCADYLVM